MEWLTNWGLWHWLVLGFLLLIMEIVVPGVFFLWWGLAALCMSVLVVLFPHLALTVLFIIYAILAMSVSLIWWRYQHHRDLYDDQIDCSLNRRDHAMLGATGKVQEINNYGIGRGYFADTTWRIQGENLQINDVIEVIAVDGITLQVRKKE